MWIVWWLGWWRDWMHLRIAVQSLPPFHNINSVTITCITGQFVTHNFNTDSVGPTMDRSEGVALRFISCILYEYEPLGECWYKIGPSAGCVMWYKTYWQRKVLNMFILIYAYTSRSYFSIKISSLICKQFMGLHLKYYIVVCIVL